MPCKPYTDGNRPKFEGLEELVWEYLNQPGQSVFNLKDRRISKESGDSNQQQHAKKPIWHNKPGLDVFVARSLNCKMSDLESDKSKNPLYKAIANEISSLRNDKILIDWKKPLSHKARLGVWRLDKTKLKDYVLGKVKAEMKEGNYSSKGAEYMISVRQRQHVFREILLGEYNQCVFCKFKMPNYLIGAHIVPYSIMRKKDHKNAMNPTNGLLLCRMCDYSFEHGDIMVEKDLGITISEHLKAHHTSYAKAWLNMIGTEICLKSDPAFEPESKYLAQKIKLVQKTHKNHINLP